MLRSTIVAAGFVALAFALCLLKPARRAPSLAATTMACRSHNDCAPVSKDKQEKCQVWIDAGNGTDDAGRKEKYKKKYFKCVGYY